jgi:hypothetical protein
VAPTLRLTWERDGFIPCISRERRLTTAFMRIIDAAAGELLR